MLLNESSARPVNLPSRRKAHVGNKNISTREMLNDLNDLWTWPDLDRALLLFDKLLDWKWSVRITVRKYGKRT